MSLQKTDKVKVNCVHTCTGKQGVIVSEAQVRGYDWRVLFNFQKDGGGFQKEYHDFKENELKKI